MFRKTELIGYNTEKMNNDVKKLTKEYEKAGCNPTEAEDKAKSFVEYNPCMGEHVKKSPTD